MPTPSALAETNAAPSDSATTGREARVLPDAAVRALREAEERRRAAADLALAPEQGGRGGAEPVRYGDWEKNGIASDF